MTLINLEELAEFLVEAQKNTFAAGKEDSNTPEGSKISTFEKGNLRFCDIWDGSEFFQGKQLVRYLDTNTAIWGVVYRGEEYDIGQDTVAMVAFLKRALMHPPIEMPVRGPAFYTDPEFPDFGYRNEWEGNLSRMRGTDGIFYNLSSKHQEPVFELIYVGGVLKKGVWPVLDMK